MEGNSSPSTHNTLMYSAVEGVEGKTEEILFDEVIAVLCIIQLSVWLLSEWLLSARKKEKTLRSSVLSVLSACHRRKRSACYIIIRYRSRLLFIVVRKFFFENMLCNIV